MHPVLEWNNVQKTVPFDDITNAPTFHVGPRYFQYWAFASSYGVLEACHIPWEETIIMPDMIKCQRELDSEFIAEENLLGSSEGVQKHIPTIANKELPSQDQMSSLTFDPNPLSNKWRA